MWAFNLLLLLLLLGIVYQVLMFVAGILFAGKKSIDGFRKGMKRHFLPSSLVSVATAGVCLIVQVPMVVTLVIFLTAFLGTAFVRLGNDEDNDQFRKL